MANTTQKHARQMHGTNPQWLVDKMIRGKVYDSLYWKEHCFALTAELLIEKVIQHVRYIGGMHGGMKRPSEFLCLLLKLLQIQPKKEIIIEFIKQKDFKYLRILSAFYFRLLYDSIEIYTYLEPLLNDYRKIIQVDHNGNFTLTYVDEIIDRFLQPKENFMFGINLPHLITRRTLEQNGQLKLRKSKLLELEKIDLDQVIEQFEHSGGNNSSPLSLPLPSSSSSSSSSIRPNTNIDINKDITITTASISTIIATETATDTADNHNNHDNDNDNDNESNKDQKLKESMEHSQQDQKQKQQEKRLKSKSRSKSGSRSKSRSKSRHKRNRSRSRNRHHHKNKNRTNRSRSRSKSRHRSRSKSKSRSISTSKSRSRSRDRSRSRSKNRSRNRHRNSRR